MSQLKGKKIIFLGSSVTYGYAAGGVSFVDYIKERNECIVIKEAVNGTTLVDEDDTSYISRMKHIKDEDVDLFVCQLSTNDATKNKKLGNISDDFDTKTVAGAIEYIIDYVNKRWNCPVVFYTNPYIPYEPYQNMVHLLLDIQKKWNIYIVDMWNDVSFNEMGQKKWKEYMADPIHPTKAGYLEWITPKMEEILYKIEM